MGSRMQRLCRRACRFRVRAEVLARVGASALATAVFVLPAGAQGVKSPSPDPFAVAASPAEVIPGQFIVTLKAGVDPDTVARETRGGGQRVDYVYKSSGRGFAGKLSDTDAERRRLGAAIAEAVAALPDGQRAVLVLREYHDLDYAEIADALELDVGTVKSRLSRARAALREHLTRELGGRYE